MNELNGISSAQEIVAAIDRTLGSEPSQDDVDTVLRMLPKLIFDWKQLSAWELERATAEPPLSVHHEFNALFEGIVAYFFHTELHRAAPEWANRTRLERQWIARQDQVERGGERLYMKIWQHTPIELLARGALFSRSEMKLV
jgi:hypothetical protein